MKRILIAMCLVVGITAAPNVEMCHGTSLPRITTDPETCRGTSLPLIPTPQKVEMGTEYADMFKVKAQEVQVKTLPVEANVDQAYQIVIEKKKVTIRYVGEEGLRNAHCTMAQLSRLYGTKLPCCTITDWPAYRYRGWMDDISRGPVTHYKYRLKQNETLRGLKYNFCNYYTEHTLYQSEFPDLATITANVPPITNEVINLQLFAHAEKTLRIPYYQHLMDSRANFNPDNEATYDFLRKRIAAAYDRIPASPFFIINCDETEQLGSGRAKHLVDNLGADQVYVNHINRCCDLIAETCHGTSLPRVAMWGDIVAKNPAMMKQLPKDMTYIMWAYEPLDSYDRLIKPFADNGTPFWVAPSLSHSSNMIPNPYRYMKNIANLARDGYRNGAEGLMNTCWDDNGEALFDNCWHGLFWSAEMAWNPLKTDDPEEFRRREEQFNRNFERLFYGAKSSDTLIYTSQLYAVGALESNPFIGDWYTSADLMEPLLNFNPDNTGQAMHERIEHVGHLIDEIHVDSAANPHVHYALNRISATMDKCRLRLYISDTALHPEIPYTVPENLQNLFDLKREYLRLWDQENGEYERYIVCNRYDDLAREVLELDRHVFVETCHGTSLPMVQLRTLYNDRPIYYTLDGSDPNEGSTRYEEPFPLERSATVKAVAYNEYGEGVVTEQYLLSHLGVGAKITINTKYSDYKSIYSGGGEGALIDGQLGSNTTYADGHWQGYWGDSIDAVIDFGIEKPVHGISMRFMQNTFDWILAPREILVYTSKDGKNWHLVVDQHFDMDPRETGMRLKHHRIDMMETSKGTPKIVLGYPVVRFLRVVVPNPGPLPDWHPAPGQPSYLFTDEIVIR